jgi:hypothetical protein
MKGLSEIPRSLQGRGHSECIPIECSCGETFLFPAAAGRVVTCPTCKAVQTFADGDTSLDTIHNGQAV